MLAKRIDENGVYQAYKAKDLKTFLLARIPRDTNPDLCPITTDSFQNSSRVHQK